MPKIVNLIAFIFYSACLFAKQTTNSEDTSPSSLPATSHKKAWIEKVQQELPTLLCDKEHYFVQCFNTSAEECSRATSLLVQACLNNVSLALPEELTFQQGEYWGQMIGRCSYDLYEKFMKSKKLNKSSCEAPPPSQNDLPKPSQAIP